MFRWHFRSTIPWRHPRDERSGSNDGRRFSPPPRLDCGFQFVDIKACHGYLGHEMLGATTRPGRYGGSLENRLRFITQIIQGIRAAVPALGIVVRASIFDVAPHRKDADGIGVPEPLGGEEPGFGLLKTDMSSALEDGLSVAPSGTARVKWIHRGGRTTPTLASRFSRWMDTSRPRIRCAACRGTSKRRRG
jgi:hypothetical protein